MIRCCQVHGDWPAGADKCPDCFPMSDIPKCDKCGIEITTGMQAMICPHADECELWPHDSDQETERFAWRMWKGYAHQAFDGMKAERDALTQDAERGRWLIDQIRLNGTITMSNGDPPIYTFGINNGWSSHVNDIRGALDSALALRDAEKDKEAG